MSNLLSRPLNAEAVMFRNKCTAVFLNTMYTIKLPSTVMLDGACDTTEYNTIKIYVASKVACKSEAVLGSELCYIL